MKPAARALLAGLLATWLALLALILLTACGGGGAAPPAPMQTPAPPPPDSQPVPPPVVSSDPPVVVDDRRSLSWVEVLREDWATPLVTGGWVRHSGLNCRGGTVDPDQPPEGSFAAGAAWAVFGGVSGNLAAQGGALHIDSFQHAGGYALLTGRIWPTDRPLAVQTTVDLRADPGAWLGITLIADETDYRELAVYEHGGRLRAGVWHPCMVDWGVAELEPGPRTLRLEYTPRAVICWRHYVDGRMVRAERCDAPGAPLVSPARVGIYVVNLRAEGLKQPGWVRATVGPLIVSKGQ